ncbi:TVP38/TMEM64 family protein [Pelagibacterium montanilacus]|uniref:TVP38/TMEM64 family protein n=1 Tax=Pelagibacterium montanilacus TaxID=2185280 RepID=UPI0013DF08DC|nr:VTT domain-containing protein [Pelagibacterium montanilacus]
MLHRLTHLIRRHGWMVAGGAALLAMAGIGYALFDGVDMSALIARYAEISAETETRPLLAFVVGTAIYSLLVLLLLPGVPLLSIPVGLILGWGMAIAVTMSATAIGISLLYVLAVWIVPDRFARGNSGMLDRMAKGLREDAVGYMLFMRLMPPVPFTVLNVALPVLRVPYVQFLLTTLAGMAPRLAAYCFAGEGLRGVIDERIRACGLEVPPCRPDFALADFVTAEIVIATVLLGVVSVAPIVFKRIRGETPQDR